MSDNGTSDHIRRGLEQRRWLAQGFCVSDHEGFVQTELGIQSDINYNMGHHLTLTLLGQHEATCIVRRQTHDWVLAHQGPGPLVSHSPPHLWDVRIVCFGADMSRTNGHCKQDICLTVQVQKGCGPFDLRSGLQCANDLVRLQKVPKHPRPLYYHLHKQHINRGARCQI